MMDELKQALYEGKDCFFPRQTTENNIDTMRLYAKHALDHVILKAQKKIFLNNQRIKGFSMHGEEEQNDEDRGAKDNMDRGQDNDDDDIRDQGFTRARVLVICPFRNQAFDLVNLIIQAWKERGSGYQVTDMSRLNEEFGINSVEEHEGNTSASSSSLFRDSEFAYQFRGNIDDCFRMGIKCTRKSLKLFSDFYLSDLIIASPLGLKLARFSGVKRRKDSENDQGATALFDFLSSIQFLVLDQVDVLAMQNWDHLTLVLDNLNKIPGHWDTTRVDINRIQQEYLDGQGWKLRQSLLCTSHNSLETHALWVKYCDRRVVKKNYNLAVAPTPYIINHAISEAVFKQIKSILAKINARIAFVPFHSQSLTLLPESRLAALKNSVLLPKFSGREKQSAKGLCIFVPGYFDYLHLKHWIENNEHSVDSFDVGACPPALVDALTPLVGLCEYTNAPDITRVRARFFNGQARVLLVTERFHFFRRYRIRGIKELIFYALPEYVHYVVHWVKMLAEENVNSDDETRVIILIEPRYERLKLERLVGTQKADQLEGIE